MAKRRRRRKKQRMMLLIAGFAFTAAVLLLILAGMLLLGGKNSGDSKIRKPAEEEALTSQAEDPQEAVRPEEGARVPIRTVKQVAGETEDQTLGIDVSEFQGNINWEEAAASGIDFVMVRVGYRTLGTGEIREDAAARYNLQEASANGLLLGAYFFSTARQ